MRRPAPELRSFGLIGTLLVAACGSPVSPLEGAYQITDGGETFVCDGGTTTEPVSGPVIIIAVGDGAMDVTVGGVTVSYTRVTYNTIQAPNSPPLTETDDAGFAQVEDWTELNLTADMLTLTGDTLTENGSGSRTAYLNSVDRFTCSFTRWFTALRDPP